MTRLWTRARQRSLLPTIHPHQDAVRLLPRGEHLACTSNILVILCRCNDGHSSTDFNRKRKRGDHWMYFYTLCRIIHYRCSIIHYSDVIMSAMASQNTGISFVYSTVCSGADQRKHQSSASLAFVRGIHRWPVNSPHKGTVTRKMFPFDDVGMQLEAGNKPARLIT